MYIGEKEQTKIICDLGRAQQVNKSITECKQKTPDFEQLYYELKDSVDVNSKYINSIWNLISRIKQISEKGETQVDNSEREVPDLFTGLAEQKYNIKSNNSKLHTLQNHLENLV